MKRLRKTRMPRKQPEEYVKHAIITEEGQERLFKLIRSKHPTYSGEQCLEVLWGNTEAPYAEYRLVRKQLEDYLNGGFKDEQN